MMRFRIAFTMVALLSILCGVATLAQNNNSVSGGQSNYYGYNEDEWYDPTDWFDGNNYEWDDSYDSYYDYDGNYYGTSINDDYGYDDDDYGYDDDDYGYDDYEYDDYDYDNDYSYYSDDWYDENGTFDTWYGYE